MSPVHRHQHPILWDAIPGLVALVQPRRDHALCSGSWNWGHIHMWSISFSLTCQSGVSIQNFGEIKISEIWPKDMDVWGYRFLTPSYNQCMDWSINRNAIFPGLVRTLWLGLWGYLDTVTSQNEIFKGKEINVYYFKKRNGVIQTECWENISKRNLVPSLEDSFFKLSAFIVGIW